MPVFTKLTINSTTFMYTPPPNYLQLSCNRINIAENTGKIPLTSLSRYMSSKPIFMKIVIVQWDYM